MSKKFPLFSAQLLKSLRAGLTEAVYVFEKKYPEAVEKHIRSRARLLNHLESEYGVDLDDPRLHLLFNGFERDTRIQGVVKGRLDQLAAMLQGVAE